MTKKAEKTGIVAKNAEKGEIVLYQPEGEEKLEVRVENETVWLTQKRTVKEYLTVQKEGNRSIARRLLFYDLDVIISVGYRVKSIQGTRFRQWALQILKDYLLKVYSINPRMMAIGMQVESRFLLVEDTVYHFGASFKDMGNEMTAYSVLGFVTPEEVIEKVKESVRKGNARSSPA